MLALHCGEVQGDTGEVGWARNKWEFSCEKLTAGQGVTRGMCGARLHEDPDTLSKGARTGIS